MAIPYLGSNPVYYSGFDLDELNSCIKAKGEDYPLYILSDWRDIHECFNDKYRIEYISNYFAEGVSAFYRTSLKTIIQTLIYYYNKPIGLIFLGKGAGLSMEEYILRVGDFLTILNGENIEYAIEAHSIDEIVALKIRGVQNFIIPITVLKELF